MSQHDFDIDNATAAAARVDINLALKALGSLSSGPSAPATTYSNMIWYDTATNWLYVRNEANSAWVRFAYLDQASNKIALVDDTSVVSTAGAQVGILGDQSTATWQAGTGTTQSLVSPANVKAAVQALAPASPITTTSGTAPYYGCRAWGKVSGNVKVSGGNFASWSASTNTVTFATSMPNANYSVQCNSDAYGSTHAINIANNGFVLRTISSGGNIFDIDSFDFVVIC